MSPPRRPVSIRLILLSFVALSIGLVPAVATAGTVRVLNTGNDRLLVNVVFAVSDAQGVLSHGWDIVEVNENKPIEFPGNLVWLRVQHVGNNNPVGFAGNRQTRQELMTGEVHQTAVNPNDNRVYELKWGPNFQNLLNWRAGENLPPGWAFIEHFSANDGETLEVLP